MSTCVYFYVFARLKVSFLESSRLQSGGVLLCAYTGYDVCTLCRYFVLYLSV